MKENLGFGCLGNGLTVWDRNRSRSNDYLTVAHIEPCGTYKIHESLSQEAMQSIIDHAKRMMEEYKQEFLKLNRYRAIYKLYEVVPASVSIDLKEYQCTEQIYAAYMKYAARHGYRIPPTAEN